MSAITAQSAADRWAYNVAAAGAKWRAASAGIPVSPDVEIAQLRELYATGAIDLGALETRLDRVFGIRRRPGARG